MDDGLVCWKDLFLKKMGSGQETSSCVWLRNTRNSFSCQQRISISRFSFRLLRWTWCGSVVLDTLIYINDYIDYDVPGISPSLWNLQLSNSTPWFFFFNFEGPMSQFATNPKPQCHNLQDFHEDTLTEYTRCFGKPPEDIWSAIVEFFVVGNARQFSCIPHQ